MNPDAQTGLALVVGLVMLLMLTLMVSAGVRMSLLEMRMSVNDEVHAAAVEQAQSLLELLVNDPANTRVPASGSVRCLDGTYPAGSGCDGTEPLTVAHPPVPPQPEGALTARLARLPPRLAPPPVGSGYSADRFVAARLRITAVFDRRQEGLGRAEVREGVSVLSPATGSVNDHLYVTTLGPFECTGNGSGVSSRRDVRRWSVVSDDGSVTGPVDVFEDDGPYLAPSHPAAVRYSGSDGSETFLALGSSDGYLRLLRVDPASAVEAWRFLAPEAQAALAEGAARRSDLETVVTTLALDGDESGRIDRARGERAYLFAGLRRGGRAYYAFDITEPSDPQLLWSISNEGRIPPGSSTRTATKDFSELGFSFSAPRVARLDSARTGLVFGGGIGDKTTHAADSAHGNAIFVVDAFSGELVWKAVYGAQTGFTADARVFAHEHLLDPIPSEAALLDSDADGIHDRIVVGDTGGNLWRADLAGDPRDWKLVRLACVGRHGGKDCAELTAAQEDRHLFHAPDIVQHRHAGRRYDAVIIGSGDRENPIGPDAGNALFVVHDPNVAPGSAKPLEIDPAQLTNVSACSPDCEIGQSGWMLELPRTGEKALSAPVTAAGQLLLATHVPPPPGDACGPGSARLYALNLLTGAPVTELVGAGGYLTLESPGVPPDAVFARPGGGGCTLTFVAGTTPMHLTACTRIRTFWQVSY